MTEKTNTRYKTCGAMDPGLRRDDDREGRRGDKKHTQARGDKEHASAGMTIEMGHWGTRGKVSWVDIKIGSTNGPYCINYSNPALEYNFVLFVMFLLLLPFILFAHIYPHLVEHCETVVAYTQRAPSAGLSIRHQHPVPLPLGLNPVAEISPFDAVVASHAPLPLTTVPSANVADHAIPVAEL